MLTIATLTAALLLSFAAVHTACAATALRWKSHVGERPFQPSAAVVLAIRGSDPTLKDCLLGLVRQEYDSYRIEIVLDSPSDPAHDVVQEVMRHSDPLRRFRLQILKPLP